MERFLIRASLGLGVLLYNDFNIWIQSCGFLLFFFLKTVMESSPPAILWCFKSPFHHYEWRMAQFGSMEENHNVISPHCYTFSPNCTPTPKNQDYLVCLRRCLELSSINSHWLKPVNTPNTWQLASPQKFKQEYFKTVRMFGEIFPGLLILFLFLT